MTKVGARFNFCVIIVLLSIISNFWFDKAYAVGYILSEDSVLGLQVSKDGPTRITMVSEKVADVFVYPREAAEVIITAAGCLLVLPQVGKEKVFLTIMGERGTMQDLILYFVKKDASPIRLLKSSYGE